MLSKTKTILRVSVLAVLAVAAFAAGSGLPNQYGNSPTLTSFLAVQPGDAAFQAGWNQGASVAAAITPSAANVPDFSTYRNMVWQNFLPQSTNRFPNDFNDGFDAALWMAAIWEWTYDPQSCHIKVCQ